MDIYDIMRVVDALDLNDKIKLSKYIAFTIDITHEAETDINDLSFSTTYKVPPNKKRNKYERKKYTMECIKNYKFSTGDINKSLDELINDSIEQDNKNKL